MECLKRLLSKCNFYYYARQVQAIELKVEEAGEYYLIFDHYTKQAQLRNKSQTHTDKKTEKSSLLS